MRPPRRVPLELITLLALSSIPLVLGIVNCAANLRAARKSYARMQVRKISTVLAKYRAENRRCPKTRDDLLASEDDRRHTFTDPWRNSVAYHCFDAGADVRSAGGDRIFNTSDDIEDSASWSASDSPAHVTSAGADAAFGTEGDIKRPKRDRR